MRFGARDTDAGADVGAMARCLVETIEALIPRPELVLITEPDEIRTPYRPSELSWLGGGAIDGSSSILGGCTPRT